MTLKMRLAKELSMSFGKKVVVAVELDESLDDVAKSIKEMEFLKTSEIHFVNVFHTINYAVGMGSSPLIYPIEADRREIEVSILGKLDDFAKKAVPQGFDGKVFHHCLFSENQKHAFSDYVKKENADLIIVATKSKHGFFESSFAQYVNKHTGASLLLIKK